MATIGLEPAKKYLTIGELAAYLTRALASGELEPAWEIITEGCDCHGTAGAIEVDPKRAAILVRRAE